MEKNDNLKLNEKLIEMRNGVRRVAALIETIEDSVSLWNLHDKWDEYFDAYWVHEEDLDKCAGMLEVELRAVEYLILWFRIERVCTRTQIEEDFTKAIQTFASLSLNGAPTPEKILDLSWIATSVLRETEFKLDSTWYICPCCDSHVDAEVVAYICQQLGSLETKIQDAWSVISRGPLGHCSYPRKKSAEK